MYFKLQEFCSHRTRFRSSTIWIWFNKCQVTKRHFQLHLWRQRKKNTVSIISRLQHKTQEKKYIELALQLVQDVYLKTNSKGILNSNLYTKGISVKIFDLVWNWHYPWGYTTCFGNSRPEVFCKKEAATRGVLRNSAKFTGKHLRQTLVE